MTFEPQPPGPQPVRSAPWLDNFTTDSCEENAVREVMKSGYLSLFEGSHAPEPPFSFYGGPWVQKLEARWKEYYAAKHAVSMNSATSGLYAAIGALGLGYGDEVICSPYTMSACATAPLIYGAIPIFADVELETGSLSARSIESCVTPRTKAILLVHQFGIPADMEGILAVAKKYELKIIEDCAQAHGAKYQGRPIGTLGDIGVFSLNVNKTIQSGEGAVCITQDSDLAYRLALIRNHGEAVVGAAGYQNIVNMIGFNYRMTELQAAIAIEQLKKLDKLNERRLEMVDYLSSRLSRFEFLTVPKPRENCHSTFYVYPLRYIASVNGLKRDGFANGLAAQGIAFAKGYVRPLYLQPLYQTKTAFKHGYPWSAPENREIKTNYVRGACPNAETLHFEQMLVNDYVRPPQQIKDMDDIVKGIERVALGVK